MPRNQLNKKHKLIIKTSKYVIYFKTFIPVALVVVSIKVVINYCFKRAVREAKKPKLNGIHAQDGFPSKCCNIGKISL